MTEMMKAYRIVEWEHAPELTEAPVPEPGPGEVVVRVAGNGLCHSDVGMAQMPGAIADMIGWKVPFTLGHEVGGHVAMVGAGVTAFVEVMLLLSSPRTPAAPAAGVFAARTACVMTRSSGEAMGSTADLPDTYSSRRPAN